MYIVKINLSNLNKKNSSIEMGYFQTNICMVNASLSLTDFFIRFLIYFVIFNNVNANTKSCFLFFFPWKTTTAFLILIFTTPQECLIQF